MKHRPIIASDLTVYCALCGAQAPYSGSACEFMAWISTECPGDLISDMIKAAARCDEPLAESETRMRVRRMTPTATPKARRPKK